MILKEKKYLKSTSSKKYFFLQKAAFEKKIAHKKSCLGSMYPVKYANFAFEVHF